MRRLQARVSASESNRASPRPGRNGSSESANSGTGLVHLLLIPHLGKAEVVILLSVEGTGRGQVQVPLLDFPQTSTLPDDSSVG